MRFEEAYSGWPAGRLTQEEAARLLPDANSHDRQVAGSVWSLS